MFSKYLLNWSIKGHQGSKLFIKTAPSPKEASHSLTLHTPLCRRRTALAGRSISYPQCSALVVRFPNEVPSYTSSLPDILVFSLCWQFSSRFAQGAMVFFFFFLATPPWTFQIPLQTVYRRPGLGQEAELWENGAIYQQMNPPIPSF